MQCAQIGCNKGGTEVTDCEAGGAKEVDMKSRLCCYSAKEEYNESYKAVLTMIESGLDNDITKKKRK